ncbi:MAG: deoxynucleoside kinase [Flavobacteriales bacterium]|nr:deoxynucleoside kinase [Flavobacteriales bacterium]
MSRPNNYEYVVIEGNIGSGKTTLTNKLAEHWGTRIILEEFMENPFLPKFYEDPKQHGFALELSFLAERYHQKRDELNKTDLFKPGVVCDYSFAKSLIFARINLDPDEFELYQNLFNIIHGRLSKPDLLVFLYCRPEKSLRQIKRRGRSYEQEIDLNYLEQINNGYMDFFRQNTGTPTVVINTENLDFVASEHDLDFIFKTLEKPYTKGMQIVEMKK